MLFDPYVVIEGILRSGYCLTYNRVTKPGCLGARVSQYLRSGVSGVESGFFQGLHSKELHTHRKGGGPCARQGDKRKEREMSPLPFLNRTPVQTGRQLSPCAP